MFNGIHNIHCKPSIADRLGHTDNGIGRSGKRAGFSGDQRTNQGQQYDGQQNATCDAFHYQHNGK